MSLASARDIAALHEITDPWLRVTTYTHARGRRLGSEGPYEFEAEVKVDPGAPLGAEFASAAPVRNVRAHLLGRAAAVRNVRAHLLGRAEEALDALAAADWHLTGAPRMEFTGRLTRYGLDDDGRPIRPPLQHDISLRLWFEVDRPRPLAERMMAPEAVADAILGFSPAAPSTPSAP